MLPYSYSLSHSTVINNAHLLLVAFAVITILTKNVSSEISNHIEHIPAKEDKSTVDSDQKHPDKSPAIATSSKPNDTETFRRSRYWRMAPAVAPMPLEAYRFERRSSAAAAAAAAAAADEDLRNFGRILKYHAVPYDGRKHAPPMPPRRPFGVKMRYKYLKQDPFVSNKYKWHQQAMSGHRGYVDSNVDDVIDDDNGGGTGDYVAFPSDDSAPYDDYYEDGQSMVIPEDGAGDYKKGEGDWFSKNYRNKLEREREPVTGTMYEDTEPALSLEHSVGKRVPFAKYGGDFESYVPGMDQRYKKPKLVRGRVEPTPEPGDWWNNGGPGGKRAAPSNAAMLFKYRRPQRPISTGGLSLYNSYKSMPPQSSKYSPFELDDSHRFKLDTMPKYAIATGAVKSVVEANKDDFEKQERDSAFKIQQYRRRNKLRDRGRFQSGPSSSSSSSAMASFNEDELASSDDGTGNRYESGSQISNDQENAILTSLRRPSQPIQEEDVVVYSSRYRNKQAAAAAAAQRVLDTSDGGAGADRADRPRFLVNYHDRPTADALVSTKSRSKFATSEESRKFNGNEGVDDTYGYGLDYGYVPSQSLPSEMDDLVVNESHSPPRKFSYKLSAPYASFSSSSPSPVYLSPASFSSSSSHQRKNNDRRSPQSPTTTTTTTSTATQKTTTTTEGAPTSLDGDSDSNSNADVVQDFDFDSDYSNHKGNGARFKASESDPERISASELIAYMSASPSEPVVSKQDRFTNEPAMLGYPYVRTFSEQREKLGSKFYKSAPPSANHGQDFEINLDQYTYRRRRRRRRSDP